MRIIILHLPRSKHDREVSLAIFLRVLQIVEVCVCVTSFALCIIPQQQRVGKHASNYLVYLEGEEVGGGGGKGMEGKGAVRPRKTPPP